MLQWQTVINRDFFFRLFLEWHFSCFSLVCFSFPSPFYASWFGFVLKEYPPYLLNLPKSSITITNLISVVVLECKIEEGNALRSFTASRFCLRNCWLSFPAYSKRNSHKVYKHDTCLGRFVVKPLWRLCDMLWSLGATVWTDWLRNSC